MRNDAEPMGIPLTFLFVLVTSPVSNATADDSLEVRLLAEQPVSAVSIQAVRHPVRAYAGEYLQDPIYELPPGSTLRISVHDGELYLETDRTGIHARNLHFQTTPEGPFILEHATFESVRTHYLDGTLHLTVTVPERVLRVTNTVSTESFIAGLLYSVPDDLPGDYLKAMAVLLRTNLQRENNRLPLADALNTHFTYAELPPPSSSVARAVEVTAGQILTLNSRPIQAPFFFSNGGMIFNGAEVRESWNASYLAAREDPFDRSSGREWSFSISADTLHAVVAALAGENAEGLWIEPKEDGEPGFLLTIHQANRQTAVRSLDLFRALQATHGARAPGSLRFSLHREIDRYVFRGHHTGHGVGLSMTGAAERARSGRTYREILNFYFPNVTLHHLGTARHEPLVRERRSRYGW